MERLTERITNRETGAVLAYRLERDISNIKAYKKLGEIEDLEEQLEKYAMIDAISVLRDLLSQYEVIEKAKERRKALEKESTGKSWIQELEEVNQNYVPKTIDDFSIGDEVTVNTSNPHNMHIYGLPAYLISGTLTVIGFTKKKVKCDWDGGKPFMIYPDLLKHIDKGE